MPEIPFVLMSCSWPRPVAHDHARWVSEPEWDAPAMPMLPQPRWTTIGREQCWMVDWREFFRGGLQDYGLGGQMRAFHVVFRIRVGRSGTLTFWDDDGSIIRRNGRVVHEDRGAHMLARTEIAVRRGDVLDVAQWQLYGGWLWGAQAVAPRDGHLDRHDDLVSYLPDVRARLATPDGPPLKFYTNARAPVRTAVAVYSLILNGFAPSRVLVYGDNQWSPDARRWLTETMPFAEVVPTGEVLSRVHGLGGSTLGQWARQYWVVMKTCVALLEPPAEFCLLDDDMLVLDSVQDALDEFRRCDLVFAPDVDHGQHYLAAWGPTFGVTRALRTATFNAGLYWCRHVHDPRWLARAMQRASPAARPAFVWEQGFIATAYADRPTRELPTQRYFYPLFDGLPGGVLGYDYERNPCGFASMHFGGLGQKPSDDVVRLLVPTLLKRRSSETASVDAPATTEGMLAAHAGPS